MKKIDLAYLKKFYQDKIKVFNYLHLLSIYFFYIQPMSRIIIDAF